MTRLLARNVEAETYAYGDMGVLESARDAAPLGAGGTEPAIGLLTMTSVLPFAEGPREVAELD